jgi:hypothetical protein
MLTIVPAKTIRRLHQELQSGEKYLSPPTMNGQRAALLQKDAVLGIP